ncbi:hypothetical protein ACHHYP_15557 [Achlya hypogyna]|uniref:Secreted protein n=1 Tax=Achlya hypogyna TaxID=1202772 RepID=A0A1V9YAP7_ACHHY|nr:hypothetical protein ACHHYP_15557 [Achlya hypogyna]
MRGHAVLVIVVVFLSSAVLWTSYQMLSPDEATDFGWSMTFRHEMSVASNDRLRRIDENNTARRR